MVPVIQVWPAMRIVERVYAYPTARAKSVALMCVGGLVVVVPHILDTIAIMGSVNVRQSVRHL